MDIWGLKWEVLNSQPLVLFLKLQLQVVVAIDSKFQRATHARRDFSKMRLKN